MIDFTEDFHGVMTSLFQEALGISDQCADNNFQLIMKQDLAKNVRLRSHDSLELQMKVVFYCDDHDRFWKSHWGLCKLNYWCLPAKKSRPDLKRIVYKIVIYEQQHKKEACKKTAKIILEDPQEYIKMSKTDEQRSKRRNYARQKRREKKRISKIFINHLLVEVLGNGKKPFIEKPIPRGQIRSKHDPGSCEACKVEKCFWR